MDVSAGTMPNLRSFAVLLLLCAGAASAACSSPPNRGQKEQLLGSWELESRTVRRSNGDLLLDPVLGQQPIGRLFYSASGHMALQMMRQARAGAITQPSNPDDASNARIVLGYDAYFGSFSINEADGTVTHHVDGSLFPEDLGKNFTRSFRVDGDRFELSFASPMADGSELTRTLVFRRSK
jgi:Lipocalin-like domain